MEYDPISVALKFGFLAVLFLFLLVIARSAWRDLRQTASPAPDATEPVAALDPPQPHPPLAEVFAPPQPHPPEFAPLAQAQAAPVAPISSFNVGFSATRITLLGSPGRVMSPEIIRDSTAT